MPELRVLALGACIGAAAALAPTLHKPLVASAARPLLSAAALPHLDDALASSPANRAAASYVRMVMKDDALDAPQDALEGRKKKAAALLRLSRIRLLNNIAIFNAIVIAFVGLSVGYEILGTDLRAIAALYYFDLGSDLYPGFARSAIAIDLLLRLPSDLIHNYEALVPTNPVFYKACTSGVAYTIGDFISQVFQGKDLKTLDLPRSARSGAAGFIGHGPLCHYWMVFMETYLDFGGAWWGTVRGKVR